MSRAEVETNALAASGKSAGAVFLRRGQIASAHVGVQMFAALLCILVSFTSTNRDLCYYHHYYYY